MHDPFSDKSDHNCTGSVKHFENDIGYLISESSYQTYESPWTSPMHFYSAGGVDNRNSRTHGTDQSRDSHKENIPVVMASDAFTPAELPLTKQEKKKSSLTSLLASNISFVSASTRNDEKRRQQYGDDDSAESVGTFPGMGEGVLNMALVMASGKLRKPTPIPRFDASNIDDDIIFDELPVKNGLQKEHVEAEVIGCAASINERRYAGHGMQSSALSSADTWRRQNADYEDEIETKSALFRDELEVDQRLNHDAARHTEVASHDHDEDTLSCASFEPPIASTDSHQSVGPFNSAFPFSKTDTHRRVTHPPLVSAMRNRGATSTEIAVAR